MAGLPTAGGLRAVDRNLQFIEDTPDANKKVAARCCRLHAAICALKKPNPEIFFEMPNPAAEIGLLERKRVRLLAETAMAIGCLCVPKVPKFDRHANMLIVIPSGSQDRFRRRNLSRHKVA